MQLGSFSVSLSVSDLAAARAFYEALGFTRFGGDPDQGWFILQNGSATIGLFQGMFEGNLLTFNPGWNSAAQPVDSFDDIRDIQARLQASGLTLDQDTDPGGSGPASIMLTDPDGNRILIDQHV